MGAAKAIRKILIDKGLTITALAEQMDKPRQTIANTFQNDRLSVKTADEYGKALGCDMFFRDRRTGREYQIYVDED